MTLATQTRLAELTAYLTTHPSVRSLTLYGSLAEGCDDEYSDIDMALDVSGTDNGVFLLALPGILAQKYPVLYTDFAPSLAPDKYILTSAIYPENPFLLLDISVTATPHCTTITKGMLSERNNLYSHTLKLFTANLKHFLRSSDCGRDIRKMAGRLPGYDEKSSLPDMLRYTYLWLTENCASELQTYLTRFLPYVNLLG